MDGTIASPLDLKDLCGCPLNPKDLLCFRQTSFTSNRKWHKSFGFEGLPSDLMTAPDLGMGVSTSFHLRASNASWHSGVHWSVIFLFFLGLVEPVASRQFNDFAILANPSTYLRRYDIILSNLRQLLGNMAHWSRPGMGASNKFPLQGIKHILILWRPLVGDIPIILGIGWTCGKYTIQWFCNFSKPLNIPTEVWYNPFKLVSTSRHGCFNKFPLQGIKRKPLNIPTEVRYKTEKLANCSLGCWYWKVFYCLDFLRVIVHSICRDRVTKEWDNSLDVVWKLSQTVEYSF